jgi:hypothetical protein
LEQNPDHDTGCPHSEIWPKKVDHV